MKTAGFRLVEIPIGLESSVWRSHLHTLKIVHAIFRKNRLLSPRLSAFAKLVKLSSQAAYRHRQLNLGCKSEACDHVKDIVVKAT